MKTLNNCVYFFTKRDFLWLVDEDKVAVETQHGNIPGIDLHIEVFIQNLRHLWEFSRKSC